MPVPKNRRKESKFEASHNYYILRDEVTKLLLNNFGYSQEKYDKCHIKILSKPINRGWETMRN